MGKIIVLVGSLRKGGNTDLLARAFAEGAGQNHEIELLSIADYKVKPCTGCNVCIKRGDHRCCLTDDMAVIYEKLASADILAVASPVYFYGISAALKSIIDRLHNPIRKGFKIKKLALLLVGSNTIPELFDAIKMQYQLSLRFFSLEDAGMVLVGGVKEKGDIKGTGSLEEAYQLGASL